MKSNKLPEMVWQVLQIQKYLFMYMEHGAFYIDIDEDINYRLIAVKDDDCKI